MFENLTNPRDIIRLAIEKMGAAGNEYCDELGNDSNIFWNLEKVRDFNIPGDSICGHASYWLQEHLPVFLKKHGIACSVFAATSNIKNGCFHHFNMVKIEGMEPVICDLTASQYFSRPMTAFEGNAYFVGTRDELRKIVKVAQQNTEEMIREALPAHEFRDLWDVDFRYNSDWDFRMALNKILRKGTEKSCLLTESFYYPMEITWGNERSHLLNRHMNEGVRSALTKTFRCAGIADLTEEKDPEIPNLVTSLSVQKLSIRDAPKNRL